MSLERDVTHDVTRTRDDVTLADGSMLGVKLVGHITHHMFYTSFISVFRNRYNLMERPITTLSNDYIYI